MSHKFLLTRKLTDYKLSENVDPNDDFIKQLNKIAADNALILIGKMDKFDKQKFVELLNEIKKSIIESINDNSEYDVSIINNECWITKKEKYIEITI